MGAQWLARLHNLDQAEVRVPTPVPGVTNQGLYGPELAITVQTRAETRAEQNIDNYFYDIIITN